MCERKDMCVDVRVRRSMCMRELVCAVGTSVSVCESVYATSCVTQFSVWKGKDDAFVVKQCLCVCATVFYPVFDVKVCVCLRRRCVCV